MQRRRILAIATALSASLLVACASEENYSVAVRSWQGASEHQLFGVWGYPNRIQKLDRGRKLLIYRTVDKGTYPITSTPGYSTVETSGGRTTVTQTSSTTMGGGSYDFRCTTWFEVNSAGRVTNTSFRGNGCTASDSFMRSRRRL